jgi:hypothetical protein
MWNKEDVLARYDFFQIVDISLSGSDIADFDALADWAENQITPR